MVGHTINTTACAVQHRSFVRLWPVEFSICRLKPRSLYSDRDSELADETKNALPLLPDIQFFTRTERFKKSICLKGPQDSGFKNFLSAKHSTLHSFIKCESHYTDFIQSVYENHIK